MKHTAIILLATFFSLQLQAQKIEKYFELITTGKLRDQSVSMEVNFGEYSNLFSFQNTSIRDSLKQLEKLTSIVDALNYLGMKNWKLVSAFPVSATSGPSLHIVHYIFKKEFELSEVQPLSR